MLLPPQPQPPPPLQLGCELHWKGFAESEIVAVKKEDKSGKIRGFKLVFCFIALLFSESKHENEDELVMVCLVVVVVVARHTNQAPFSTEKPVSKEYATLSFFCSVLPFSVGGQWAISEQPHSHTLTYGQLGQTNCPVANGHLFSRLVKIGQPASVCVCIERGGGGQFWQESPNCVCMSVTYHRPPENGRQQWVRVCLCDCV